MHTKGLDQTEGALRPLSSDSRLRTRPLSEVLAHSHGNPTLSLAPSKVERREAREGEASSGWFWVCATQGVSGSVSPSTQSQYLCEHPRKSLTAARGARRVNLPKRQTQRKKRLASDTAAPDPRIRGPSKRAQVLYGAESMRVAGEGSRTSEQAEVQSNNHGREAGGE